MPGYREITVPEARAPRRRTTARAIPVAWPGDWRAVLAGAARAAAGSCRTSPGTALGSLVALGAAGFVCFNALGHQSGRHPAPILPKVAQKAPPPREAPADPAGGAAAPAPWQAARDPIRDLLRADETTASVTPRMEPAKPAARPVAKSAANSAAGPEPTRADRGVEKPPGKPEEAVLRAQRALAKLGYAVKPDGAMGPGTRAAIETFERTAKLPVTGEAAGRTLRALVARAGQG